MVGLELADMGYDLYNVTFEECGHRYLWSTRQVCRGEVDERYDLRTNLKQNSFFCDECSPPREQKVAYIRKIGILEKKGIIYKEVMET